MLPRQILAPFVVFLLAGSLHAADATPKRIVFIGDSITDGNTYPLLVKQALVEAKKPVPACINAGVAGDTAAGMHKRLERDVLPHKPDLVMLSAGINDILRKVSTADYEKDMAGIAERLQKEKIALVLLTPSILGPKHAEAEKKLADYIAAIRTIAEKHGVRVAEVHERMKEGRAAKKEMLEPDEIHLSFAGYQAMTRAVLDALGHKDAAVPAELKIELMPGIIKDWRIHVVAKKEVGLDEKSVANLKPGDDWKPYTLPETEANKQWWLDQERRRGFAMSLDRKIGPGKLYLGYATIDSPRARKVYFNTGAQLNGIWLNGKRIYKNDAWTGWHAGKERIAADLVAGKNVIVIETGSQFFLSVTDTNDW
jgi:lysophospholipase L1-like esterase